ncbi:MAG TPA: C25 family peptidase propeptide domain-containing protein, partial [Ignavibacteria bacterium]|nr:C25 family peptidase propeptide domain-containing protein [Ignavibacteria bacterium]
MKALKLFIFLIILITSSISFAQDKELLNETTESSLFEKLLQADEKADYKIISSNSSYIEIEFYPSNITGNKLNFSGETFDAIDFSGSSSYDIKSSGEPNLKFRSFNIALPSDFNNTVQVIDFDVKNMSNINLSPVPFFNYKIPGLSGFENIVYSYIKGSKYSENKFFPDNIASLSHAGNVRELTTAALKIYPFQYNPISRVMKVYTRVRVRVSFGSAPIQFNRPRSRQEIELLKDIALNSNLALNWLNPKYKGEMGQNALVPSVLANGDWYKIEIKDNSDDGKSEGIYKISKGFLDSAGINVNNVDPRTIKMYGNGGEILNIRHEADRPGDLQQIKIFIEGENDGVFNAQDYILFYASSINKWYYDTTQNVYTHFLNYYSKSNYYWLCINTPNNGSRISVQASSPNSPQLTPSFFIEKLFREPDEVNLLNEGNLWLSNRIVPGGSKEWSVTLTGLEAGSDILYRIKPASRCLRPPESNENHMLIKDDYSTMAELFFPMGYVAPGFGNWIWTEMTTFTINQSQKTNGEQVKFRGSYSSNNSAAEGYMDWWEIQYKRR